MRKSVTLVSAAVVAVSASAAAMSQATAADPTSSRASDAILAARSHAASTHFGSAQAFQAVGTIVDADGTSHVRLHRTYRGLPVVGGDLVVHQAKGGAWKGSSLTLGKSLSLATTPAVSKAAAGTAALAPSATTRGVSGAEVSGSTLVVDATGATPRLAWKVLSGGTQSDGTPSRLASYVDAKSGKVLRTEQEIVNVDGTGNTLYSGIVPLSVTKSGTTYQLKNDGVRGGTYTTDMANASDSYACQVFGTTARPAPRSPARRPRSATASTATGPRPAPTRSTAATRRGTTTRTRSAATASSTPARAPSTGCTTARTTSTPSGTARR